MSVNKKFFLPKALVLSLMFVFSFGALASWDNPTASPTAGNSFSPINQGASIQRKIGPLVVTGFRSYSFANFDNGLIIGDNRAPSEKLDVVGLAKINQFQMETGALNNYVLVSDANGNATWTDPTTLPGVGLSEVSWGQINGSLADQGDLFGELTNIQDSLNLKAPINNPAFEDNPTAPTPTLGDNDTSLATTAFVQGAMAGLVGDVAWDRNASLGYIFMDHASDKVGLGINNPSQQLHLSKSMELPQAGTSDGGILYKGDVPYYNSSGNLVYEDVKFLHDQGTRSVFLGARSGMNSTGVDNTGLGHLSMWDNAGGSYNVAIGRNAVGSVENSDSNTAVGSAAFSDYSEGNYNTAFGFASLNLYNGFGLPLVPANLNVSVGAGAMEDARSADRNVAIGRGVLRGYLGGADTGMYGDDNVAIGYKAGETVNNGSNNIIIGPYTNLANQNINNSTVIGKGTSSSWLEVTASNAMLFGNTEVNKWGFGKNVSAGNLMENVVNGAVLNNVGWWMDASDINYKYDINDTKYGLAEVMQLRPVSFKWKSNNETDIGFIAQEVEKIIPEVVSGEDGSKSMSYDHLTAVLINATKQLREETEEFKSRVDKLELN